MGFDVSKWNKQRYLAEAGIIQEVEIDTLHDLLYNADPSYSNLAKAIAKFLKGTEEDTNSGFSKDQINDFMKILHTELGMEPLNEAETFDMDDDSLLSTYENKLKAHDWYYYMSDDSRKYDSGGMEAKTLSDIKTELGKRGLADKAKELFNKYEKTL